MWCSLTQCNLVQRERKRTCECKRKCRGACECKYKCNITNNDYYLCFLCSLDNSSVSCVNCQDNKRHLSLNIYKCQSCNNNLCSEHSATIINGKKFHFSDYEEIIENL